MMRHSTTMRAQQLQRSINKITSPVTHFSIIEQFKAYKLSQDLKSNLFGMDIVWRGKLV